MKKLLSLLGAFGLTATTSATVVACGKNEEVDKSEFDFNETSNVIAEISDTPIGFWTLYEKDEVFKEKFYKYYEVIKKTYSNKELEEGKSRSEIIYSITGEKDIVSIDKEKNKINFLNTGKTTIVADYKHYLNDEVISTMKITLNLTVIIKFQFEGTASVTTFVGDEGFYNIAIKDPIHRVKFEEFMEKVDKWEYDIIENGGIPSDFKAVEEYLITGDEKLIDITGKDQSDFELIKAGKVSVNFIHKYYFEEKLFAIINTTLNLIIEDDSVDD